MSQKTIRIMLAATMLTPALVGVGCSAPPRTKPRILSSVTPGGSPPAPASSTRRAPIMVPTAPVGGRPAPVAVFEQPGVAVMPGAPVVPPAPPPPPGGIVVPPANTTAPYVPAQPPTGVYAPPNQDPRPQQEPKAQSQSQEPRTNPSNTPRPLPPVSDSRDP